MTGIGVAAWCLDWRDPPSMEALAALQISALHVDFGHPEDPDSFGSETKCRQHFDRTGQAGIVTTAFALNALETMGVTAEAAVDLVRHAIDTAARWSVPLVYLPHFGRARIDGPDAFRAAVALLRMACEFAEPSAVCVATENVLGPTQGLRLLADVDHPKLRALVDLYNPVLHGHAARDILQAQWPYLARDVHVKDGCDGVLGNAPVGEGDANFEDSADFLVRNGIGLTAILENDYAQDGENRMRRDIAKVRQSLGPVLAGPPQPVGHAAARSVWHDRA